MPNRIVAEPGDRNRHHASARPPHIHDDVAEKTGWSPLKSWGRTRKIGAVGASRLEFRFLQESISLYVYFMIIGTVSFFILVSQPRLSSGMIGLALGCVLLFIASGLIIFYLTTPLVFDKIRGFFWRGHKKPDDVRARQRPDSRARLGEIHALQILEKRSRVRGDAVYELNLVLQDATRIHLTDQENLATIREYAETLSHFLERPVWDAVA
jgi:hypothetical protein